MDYHRIPVPKVLAMVITSLQLLQMVLGCGVNILAWNYKANGSRAPYLVFDYNIRPFF